MYHVEIEGCVVLATKKHWRAKFMYRIYRLLFPSAEILIDYNGIICD